MPEHKETPGTGTPGDHTTTQPTASEYNAQPAARPGKSLAWLPCTWDYPQDLRSQLDRRREAALRLPPICDRCGARDPLVCRCWTPEPALTKHQLDGWRAAIERTLPLGPPLVPVEVLQKLYRNQGTDRELALRVWAETGGLVA